MTDTFTSTDPVLLPPALSRQKVFELVRAGKLGEALEPARALQAAFERGEIHGGGMTVAMSVFEAYRPELTERIVENAETCSGDYRSTLAAGLHYTALLWVKRTGCLGRNMDIPELNRPLMVDAAEKADIYLSRPRSPGVSR
jgi:hypothetical protein